MSELTTAIQKFFAGYESANAAFDVDRIADCYADVFLFGGPQGVQSIKKDDFVKVLPRRKDFFRSVGLVSSKVDELEVAPLDARYNLVKVFWKMRFESATRGPIESQNSASYILSATADSFQIVVQLDHQDLRKKVQESGLK